MKITRTFSMAGVLALTVALTGGCIVQGGGGGGGGTRRGDLTILYTFGGALCAPAGVDRIVVDIDGVNVADNDLKDVTCAEFSEGITVREFLVGDYDVTIEGWSGGRQTYGMAAPMRVAIAEGTNSYDVNVPTLMGDLTVYWQSFGGTTDCTAAGVSSVRALLWDSSDRLLDDQEYACSAAGVTWPLIEPGAYVVGLDALGAGGGVLYTATTEVTVRVGRAETFMVDLVVAGGDLTLYWTFAGSGTCGTLTDVHVYITDPWDVVYDDFSYDCLNGGVAYTNLAAGTWRVTLEGMNSSGQILYRAAGRDVSVTAGQLTEYTIDLAPN